MWTIHVAVFFAYWFSEIRCPTHNNTCHVQASMYTIAFLQAPETWCRNLKQMVHSCICKWYIHETKHYWKYGKDLKTTAQNVRYLVCLKSRTHITYLVTKMWAIFLYVSNWNRTWIHHQGCKKEYFWMFLLKAHEVRLKRKCKTSFNRTKNFPKSFLSFFSS